MSVSFELEQALNAELSEGETILWQGRPDPKRSAMAAGPTFLFAIPWTAFFIFWIYSAMGAAQNVHNTTSSLFPWFGLPFLLVGVAMLLSPLWAAKKAEQSVYAVTNNRAIVLVGGKGRTVNSYYARDMGEITRTERADGTGDVIFARKVTQGSESTQVTNLGFIGIPNPHDVEKLIRTHILKNEPPYGTSVVTRIQR